MTAGYRSFEGAWIGGASAPAANPPAGGYRSFLAFWLGGAAATTAVVTPPTGGTLPRYSTTRTVDLTPRRKRINPLDVLRIEDEEIVIL